MKRSKTDYIVVHTAAWPGDPSADDIRRVHVEENGWQVGGYHFVIRKDGRIEKGRDALQVGAHCRASNMNDRSIGVCCSGHGDQEPFTDAQRESLVLLVNSLRDTLSIPIRNVIGHREAGAKKTCPGTKVDMDELRDYIKQNKAANIDTILSGGATFEGTLVANDKNDNGLNDDFEELREVPKRPDYTAKPKTKNKNMLQRILSSRIAKGITSAIGGILGFGGSVYSGIDPNFALVVAGTVVVALFMGMDQAARFIDLFSGELPDNDNSD